MDLVLAHNDPQRSFMIGRPGLDESKVIAAYDTWAGGGPIDLVVGEFLGSRTSREYGLAVTGDYGRSRRLYRRVARVLGGRGQRRANRLPAREEYYWLVENCGAVVVPTSSCTPCSSALQEAVAHGKPFVASETRTLRSTLGDYPCLFRLEEGSARGVLEECVYSPPLDAVEETVERLRGLSAASVEELKRRLAALRRGGRR